MSSLRLFAVPVCALLLSTACGRTEAVFVATGQDTAGDTWSYEDTVDPPEDMPGWETIADEDSGSDDWMTGDWGDDDPDTWGDTTADTNDEFDTNTDVDTFDTFDTNTDVDTFDTFDTNTDVDTFDTNTDIDTDTDTNTTDTNTDTTDTNTDTTDTNTDTTDTNTDTATDTNTDTATDTNTDTATDTNTDTATDTNTDTTDTATTDTGGDTCSDAASCLVDCGSFSGMCINDCTTDLPDDQANLLYDLQICAIQACFFLGQCQLGDFNSPECVQCRLDGNVDPESIGCGPEGMACGI